jgi:ribosomal protein S18 acetylase RimI-like enzyme
VNRIIVRETQGNMIYRDFDDGTKREIQISPDRSAIFICAKQNDREVAWATLEFAKGYCRVWAVSTDNDFRRRGYATALMRFAELICRQRGVPEIDLFASATGRLLYETLGYKMPDGWKFENEYMVKKVYIES